MLRRGDTHGVDLPDPLGSEPGYARPVAEIAPIEVRPRWMTRRRFVRDVLAHQADPTLAADLAALADETTDDLPWR